MIEAPVRRRLRIGSIAFVFCIALLLLAASTAAAAPPGNDACLTCHTTGGQATHTVDFSVGVDYGKCDSCHWYSVHDFDSYHVGPVYQDYMSRQCNSCHHASDIWPTRPAIIGYPTALTPYGWFQTQLSVEATAGQLHAIHANGGWLAGKGECVSCHGAASCDACHTSTDASHSEHASLGTSQLPTSWNIGKKYRDTVGDTYIYSSSPAGNYDTATTLYAGRTGTGEQRFLLRFPLTKIPSPSDAATVTLQLTRTTGAAFPLRAYRLRRTDWSSAQATWNSYKTGSAWGSAGAGSTTLDYFDAPYAESTDGSFDVTALFQAAIAEGKTTLDLLVLDPAPVARRYAGFYSSSVASADWAPLLKVDGYRSVNLYAYGPVEGTVPGDPGTAVEPTETRSCVAAACHDLTLSATDRFAPECVSCHPDRAVSHGYDAATHLASPAGASYTIGTVTYGPFACSTCHALELGAEHAKSTSSGNARGCAQCHPTPRDTLAPWDKSCAQGGCHTSGPLQMHAQIDADHTRLPANDGCFGTGCHTDGDLAAIHASAEATVAGVKVTSCGVCHAAGVPSSKDCTVCHPDRTAPHGFDPVKHTADDSTMAGTNPGPGDNATYNPPVSYSLQCSACHSLEISEEHGGTCAKCHPTPRNSFETWNKTCSQNGCHAIHTGPPHGTVIQPSHAMGAADVAAGCGFVSATTGRRPCHYRDLVQEHNRTINQRINPATNQPELKQLSVSCLECHNSPAFNALGGNWNGSCGACHNGTTLPNHAITGTDRYNEVYAKHNNPSGYYDNGSGAAGTNAMDVHGWIRDNPDPNSANKTIGCGAPTCHTQAYLGGGWPYYTTACSGCHGPSIAIPDPYQGDYAWYSDYWLDDQAMDTRLTMTLDPITLPAGSSLDFKTWYDIENGWDYGYVQVSTDGGATWTNLQSAITTSTNPYGQNQGNGITGSTGSGWRDGHFDLSAYAGQTVKIRFAYIADFYTYGLGWMLDTISVGPPGAPVFTDDVETAKPEWNAQTELTYYDYDLEDYVTAPTTATGWRRFTR